MNTADIVMAVFAAAVIVGAVILTVRTRRRGRGCCGRSCSKCMMCDGSSASRRGRGR